MSRDSSPGHPSLEIFVPFWGDPVQLYDAVDSIRAQTDPSWTAIVVDDCYPDPSVAENFAAETDPRIRYLRNTTNLGIAGNFQQCLDLASGDLVMFMGCDDLLHPSFTARARAGLERFPDAALYQPGVRVVDDAGRPAEPLADRVKRWLAPRVDTPTLLAGQSLATSLLHGNWLYWPSLVFRTERLRHHSFRQTCRSSSTSPSSWSSSPTVLPWCLTRRRPSPTAATRPACPELVFATEAGSPTTDGSSPRRASRCGRWAGHGPHGPRAHVGPRGCTACRWHLALCAPVTSPGCVPRSATPSDPRDVDVRCQEITEPPARLAAPSVGAVPRKRCADAPRLCVPHAESLNGRISRLGLMRGRAASVVVARASLPGQRDGRRRRRAGRNSGAEQDDPRWRAAGPQHPTCPRPLRPGAGGAGDRPVGEGG